MNKPLPFVLLTALACGSYSGHADAEVIVATQDSYIRDGSSANTNFGSDVNLDLKQGSGGFERIVYLDFDVSSVTLGSIISAELELEVLSLTDAQKDFTVYGITESWDEGTITWNNAPFNEGDIPFGTDVGSGSVTDPSGSLLLNTSDLLDFVKNNTSGTVSLVVVSTGNSNNGNLSFHSTEGPNDSAPTLTLTVPEPGSLALMGLAGLLIARRRHS